MPQIYKVGKVTGQAGCRKNLARAVPGKPLGFCSSYLVGTLDGGRGGVGIQCHVLILV